MGISACSKECNSSSTSLDSQTDTLDWSPNTTICTTNNNITGISDSRKSRNGDGVVEQFMSALAVSYVCLSSGIFVAYTSAAVPSMKLDSANFPNLSHYDISWIGGLSPLGAMIGSVLSVFPIRSWGSRNTILYFASPFLIASWVMIAFAPSLTWIFIGRFLGGAGGGIGMSSAPLYCIEIADDSLRGRLGIMPQFLLIVGIWLSNVLGSVLEWRDLALAAAIISLPAVVLLVAIPNSPAFFIARNRMDDAALAYRFFRGQAKGKPNGGIPGQILKRNPNALESETEAEAEAGVGATSTVEDTETEVGLMNAGKGPNSHEPRRSISIRSVPISRRFDLATVKACVVALGVMSFQQLTGINGVTFYAVTIFKETPGVNKLSPYLPAIFAIFLATTQIIAVLISTYFVERLGRKILLLMSGATLAVTAGSLSGFFYACPTASGDSPVSSCDNFHWFPLLALIIFVFGFAIGFGPLCWVVVTEILPTDVRNVMNPVSIGYSWFCIFLVTKSFPVLMIEIQLAGIFAAFSAVALGSVVFIYFCLPETKGKSLEEIQKFFGKKIVVNNV